MTQKELLYFEDAIGHIGNIMKILEESIKNVEDEKILSFMQNELSIQNNLKQNLMNMLEGKANG